MLEAERLVDFLGLRIPEEGMRSVVERYDSERIRKGRSPAKGHLHKGLTGRWKSVMTPSQKALCEELFREYLPRMGY
jgi:hypothetical protein